MATLADREIRDAAREVFAAPAPWDERWRLLGELGWLGMGVPDSLGGAELGLAAEIVLFEEAAHALADVPLLSALGLALPALVAAGDEAAVGAVLSGDAVATLAWAEADGPFALRDAGRAATTVLGAGVSGTKRWVPDAVRAGSFVVVAAGPTLVQVARGDVTVTPVESSDETRPLADVELAGAPAKALAVPARETLATIWRRTLTLAAAEAVGVARRMLEESAAYAKTRVQFGRPIGSYQAVSHKIADMYVALELSRALVRDAAASVDAGSEAATAAVAAAAAKALPTAVQACEHAIQIHGGIGMTWESPLHRYYKRALGLAALDGPAAGHRAVFADAVLA